MNLSANISTIRGGSVSADFCVGRGSQFGAPKKTFGAPPGGTGSDLKTALDRIHTRLRGATSTPQLCDLLDEYCLLAALIAKSQGGTTASCGGRILSAALKAVETP